MGEGFGDFLTVAFFHPISGNWHEAQVFDWDGNHNDNFWPGRRVDGNKHYPADMDGEVHDDGEIWSRALWDIMNDIGYDTSLQVVLESHFSLTPTATFRLAANAIVQADMDLYNGRHLMDIGQAFLDRGIFTELPVHLEIHHAALTTTENQAGPYPILATMNNTFPMASLSINYRFQGDTAFSIVEMTPTANPHEYQGLLPGPGHQDTVFYYLHAADSMNFTSNLPVTAPATPFHFYVGPDTIRPIITHTPIGDLPPIGWPPTINATVTDNLGVDSVWVEFNINGDSTTTIALARVDTTNNFRGVLTGTVVPFDTVSYRIKARDRAVAHNVTYLPGSGYFSFGILETQTAEYMADGFDIPDGARSVADTIIIPEHLRIYAVDIYVNITHPYIGDLYFYIYGSTGNRRVTLHNRSGADGDSIVGWYDDDITPDGPGAMTIFNGDSCQGRWILYVADRATGNVGHLNSWGIRIVGTGIAQDVYQSGEPLPNDFALNQNYPNPFNPSTKISFTIPEAGAVKLEVFDILGRKVATLLDASLTAGNHLIEWDGKSSEGVPVSSGVYFARLATGDKSGVIRMSLLK